MNTPVYTDTETLVQDFRRHTMDRGSLDAARRGMRVESDVRELEPWLKGCASGEAALVELHATLLRFAAGHVESEPEHVTAAAAVLFGLTRAVQQGSVARGRIVTVEAVLRCVAHVLAAVHTPPYLPDRSRHLDMARAWMAQAHLHVGAEAGAR